MRLTLPTHRRKSSRQSARSKTAVHCAPPVVVVIRCDATIFFRQQQQKIYTYTYMCTLYCSDSRLQLIKQMCEYKRLGKGMK